MFISDGALREINEKFVDGDGLDDNELFQLLELYERLEADLKILGPHFHLAWKEVRLNLNRLEQFERSRGFVVD